MIVIIIWLAEMCLAGWIGRRKGMTSLGWGLGAAFGIVGAVIIACIPRRFTPVWQRWMRKLNGRGRIIGGAVLLLAWMVVPSISDDGVSLAQVHAECQSGLAMAQAFDPGIGRDCGDVSNFFMFLNLGAVAGLLLVLWGLWMAWGATLVQQGRKLSAISRPASRSRHSSLRCRYRSPRHRPAPVEPGTIPVTCSAPRAAGRCGRLRPGRLKCSAAGSPTCRAGPGGWVQYGQPSLRP